MLRRYLIAALVLGAIPVSAAHASGDDGCDPETTLRQTAYSCSGVPFLSPANDSRINSMLLMAHSDKLASTLPSRQSMAVADQIVSLGVPFTFDYSGWIYIGDKAGDESNSNDTNADDSNQYADGEGNVCRSASAGGDAFDDALKAAASLPDSEATRLRAARADMEKICGTTKPDTAWSLPTGITSPLGQQFATYLQGADAFYAGNFADAVKDFDSLKGSADPWLKEAALYMVGRAQLNSAQTNAFNNDGVMTPDSVDKTALGNAETAFHAYLSAYPHGSYATSAQGLLRRVYWLGDNKAQLATAYDKAFADWSPTTSNVGLQQLANEMDSKLALSAGTGIDQVPSPSVLAIVDLMHMRSGALYDRGAAKVEPLTLAELQAQKTRFAGAPALYDYLLAVFHVYVDKNPQQALTLLPTSPGASLDYFALSQQTLRGFALEDSGKTDEAQKLWEQLIPLAKLPLQRESVELALAINLEHAGHADRVFAPGSLVQDPGIRGILLEQAADAHLLRAQVKDSSVPAPLREIALYTLLYKELTHAHYQDFLADLALLPTNPSDALKPFTLPGGNNDVGYTCPSIRDVATTLQQHPDDAKGQNCLAEFVRNHWPTDGQTEGGAVGSKDDLGGAPSLFPGKHYQRMDSYLKVIGNEHASGNDRAYALYRAVNCFAPTGTSECGGNDIPVSTRKKWFNTLKSAYGDTSWADSLKYYW